MKTTYIEALKAGDAVEDVFVLAEKSLGRKKDGGSYLTIALADRSGTLKGVVWERVDEIAAGAAAGDFVRVKGAVGEYRGELQLVVRAMQAVPAETVAPQDFLPATSRDVEGMFERLTALTASLTDAHLRELLAAFWRDPQWVARFKRAPAAKLMHHAYIGGLLEHTLSMASLADKVAAHYGGVDRDLLIAGAVLHDIGKLEEFEYRTRIDYSDQGRLVSHIVIGVEMLDARIREVPGFPEKRAWLLKHMIVSHHGSREFGSPEPPKTIEAVLLNYIDEIDSKVNGIREFMASEAPGEAWTSYHRLLGRHFYKGTGEA